MSEERFSQIENLLRTAAKMLVNHQELLEAREREINDLRTDTNQSIKLLSEQVTQTSAQVAQLSEMFVESVGIMRTMQSEIRDLQLDVKGIQTENQRILRHLFGEE